MFTTWKAFKIFFFFFWRFPATGTKFMHNGLEYLNNNVVVKLVLLKFIDQYQSMTSTFLYAVRTEYYYAELS